MRPIQQLNKYKIFSCLYDRPRTNKAQRNTTVDTRATEMKDLKRTIDSNSLLDIVSLLRKYCVKIEITLERR